MKLIITLGLYVLAALICAPSLATVPSSSWSDFAGGPLNTRRTTASGADGPVEVLWELSTPGMSLQYQAVLSSTGEIVFTGYDNDRNGALYAVDSGGNLKWQIQAPDRALSRWPAITSDGQVIVTSQHPNLTIYSVDSYDLHTGELLWRTPTISRAGRIGPAVDDNDNIYVPIEGNWFVSLDSVGNERWGVPGGGGTNNPIISPDGTIYTTVQNVTAFNSDGDVLWTSPRVNTGTSNLTLHESGTILVSSSKSSFRDGDLYAIGPTGEILWDRSDLAGGVSIGPTGTMYAHGAGRLHAVDVETGVDVWSRVVGTMSPQTQNEGVTVAAEGRLYLADQDGVVSAWSPDGDFLWSYDLVPLSDDVINPGAPVIGENGVLYVTGGRTERIFALAIIPEPTTFTLAAFALLGLVGCPRRVRRRMR